MGTIFKYDVTSGRPRPNQFCWRTPFPPSPFLLCQVCTSWKNIIFNGPSLWAKIHINGVDPGEFLGPLVHKVHASAKSWIARVGTHPSSLSIHTRRSGPQDRTRLNVFLDDSLPSLLPQSVLENVTRLDFRGDAWESGLRSLNFPAVESVVVDSNESVRLAGQDRRDWPILNFFTLPAVRKAVLMGLDHDSSNLRPTSRIQWNQLTHLYLGKQVSYAKALMVLKTATALEQGCFDLENSRLLEYMPTNTTLLRESDGFLPNLKDLTFLRNSPFGNPFSDYGQFSWPSLIALRLCIRDRLSWNSSTPLLFGSLTNLHLRTSNVTEFGTGVAPILNACPLLASLTLDLKLEEYRPFFEFLTLDPARPHLVHLASLKIFWEEGLGDSDAAFHAPVYEMLASRTDICAKSEEGSDSEHSSPATAVVPDNFSLKTFTLYLGGQPAADEVAKIGRNFAGLERFMEISVFGRKRWKPMKIWEEIPLDHWDDGVGPMLDSEDGLILESEDDFWYDYESDY